MGNVIADFDFDLPEALIAQKPAQPRDSARLLIYDRSNGTIIDDIFSNVDNYLVPATTLVLNNSKVEKCRLRFGATEVFVVETVNPTTVRALVRPGRKFKTGATVVLDQAAGITADVIAIEADGLRLLRLRLPLTHVAYDQFRLTPLPPYIAQDESLSHEYQTVYAKPLGSKAAPTAGLHFTHELLEKLHKDHPIAELTLHVGMGTFAPVKSDNIAAHHMHSEWFSIDANAAQIINEAKHITAVGTTSVRTLESAADPDGRVNAMAADTAIFITPGYRFKCIDSLITNFHLPKSTLLMLVSAHMGSVEAMHRVYAHAIKNRYRFYSFGDAMLII